MSVSSTRRFLTASVLVSAVSVCIAVDVPRASAEEPGVIEEIVVTARKRAETFQETPVAMAVIGERTLENYRLEDIEKLGQMIPGLNISPTFQSGAGMAFRGIGSPESSPFATTSVAGNLDGVSMNNGDFTRLGLFDVAQVEMLKGPQPLYFGKNTTAGILSIRSKDPSNEFEGVFSAGYETEADERIGNVILSGPISSGLLGRIAVSYKESDGWLTLQGADVPGIAYPRDPDRFPNQDTLTARGTLLFSPTDRMDVRTKLTYFTFELMTGQTAGMQRIHCPFGTAQAVVPIDDCRINDTGFIGNIHPEMMAAAAPSGNFPGQRLSGYQELDQLVASVEVNYDFDAAVLTSVTGYFDSDTERYTDQSFEPASKIMSGNPGYVEQFSQEIRLTSTWDRSWNYMLGGFYEDKETLGLIDVWLSPVVFGVPINAGEQRPVEDALAYSVFGELSWALTPSLDVSGGLRYSYEDKSMDMLVSGVTPPNLGKDNDTWSNVSGELTLRYQPSDTLMAYASYKTGFKSGGLDGSYRPAEYLTPGLPPVDLPYDEETVAGFETGLKAQLLDSTLQLNAAAFRYEYDDMQVSIYRAETNSLYITNAAKATVAGVELDGVWVPAGLPGLTLRAAVNYLDAETDEFLAPCWAGQSIEAGCDQNLVGGIFRAQDLSGRNLSLASDWAGLIGVGYDLPVGRDWRVELSADANYTGKFNGMSELHPEAVQDGFWKANVAARLYSTDGRWELAARSNNITDEYTYHRVLVAVFTGSGSGTDAAVPPDLMGSPNPGRTLTFDLTYRIGGG